MINRLNKDKAKKLYIFSYVPLGFGSPQFVYLINNILLKRKYDINVLEVFRFWIPIVNISFNGDVSRRIIGSFFGRKINVLRKHSIIFRLLNWINIKVCFFFSVANIIIRSYFDDITIIVTEPSLYFLFFSNHTKIIEYNLEIWEEETSSNKLSMLYRKKVKAVIFPQKDRMQLSLNGFNKECKVYLIENACEAPNYDLNLRKYLTPRVIFSGRVTRYNIDYISAFSNYFDSKNIDIIIAGNIDVDVSEKFHLLVSHIEKLKYLGFITNIELREIIRDCSIGLILWGNDTLNTRYCAPNKLYEYMSEGLMVISIDNKSMIDFNDNYKFGYIISDQLNMSNVDTSTENLTYFGRKNFETVRDYLNYSSLCAKFLKEIL